MLRLSSPACLLKMQSSSLGCSLLARVLNAVWHANHIHTTVSDSFEGGLGCRGQDLEFRACRLTERVCA